VRRLAAALSRILIASFETGQAINTFDPIKPLDNPAVNVSVRWSPDGRSILYVNSREGISNLD